MLGEFGTTWNGHMVLINREKHRIELLNKLLSPFHSASCWEGVTTRKLTAAEIRRMITEKVIEPATTKWAAPIVFFTKKDDSLHFCVE